MIYTTTTQDISKMNRTDLVFEIAKKAHIDHYQTIITWPTEMIRKLMYWYHNADKQLDPIVKQFIRSEANTVNKIRHRIMKENQIAGYIININ